MGFFDANRSVQRVFGQLVLFLPMTGMMTAVLLRLLQNTSVLIRIDARVMIARRILGELIFLTAVVTFSVWGIWFTAVLLWSRVGQSGTAVVANVNLVMNVATALFTYTMLTLIGCLLFRSRAIGIFCGLSLVIVFHAAPVFNLSEIATLITPKLAVNAMWPISVVKQFLMMIFVTGLMVLTLRRIRLPVEV
ncbi:hypothetical protein LSEI_0177 [Lacticaseibacillus paracasei ATCC 334]|uniref:Uncharacterized protein n=2 Tax=Lacticaseibacillus paracasei TaxID=1597 RepID=Q03CN2_LACP3|nr:hypothetical protein LSEI_0177 [Lacticaseibacillus paracasei ATCC 334]AWN85234.1 hypothetical protein LPEG9_00850 [Lacticaseibacillus paracasei]EPC59656.1 hypothetical protein Lpp14_13374 [Lacticaseibacillus paracasei subsp. paracasei Lpp14]MCT3361360.1 hypothetical protein [Lacticaseibacillus paracasei]MCT4394019.1 hypothetical protein [Lacticaseibacillus paracasei]